MIRRACPYHAARVPPAPGAPALHEKARSLLRQLVPRPLRRLRWRLAQYRNGLWLRRQMLRAGLTTHEAFQRRYLTNFWVVAARKQSA